MFLNDKLIKGGQKIMKLLNFSIYILIKYYGYVSLWEVWPAGCVLKALSDVVVLFPLIWGVSWPLSGVVDPRTTLRVVSFVFCSVYLLSVLCIRSSMLCSRFKKGYIMSGTCEVCNKQIYFRGKTCKICK